MNLKIDFETMSVIEEKTFSLYHRKIKFTTKLQMLMVSFMVFNNISVISWRPVLLVEETGVPRENHQPVTSHSQTLSHNVVSSTHRLSGIRNHKIYATEYASPLIYSFKSCVNVYIDFKTNSMI